MVTSRIRQTCEGAPGDVSQAQIYLLLFPLRVIEIYTRGAQLILPVDSSLARQYLPYVQ